MLFCFGGGGGIVATARKGHHPAGNLLLALSARSKRGGTEIIDTNFHQQQFSILVVALGNKLTNHMDAAAELGRNPVSKHQIQPTEYGDEQADAERDCRTRLAQPNSPA